MNGNGRGVILGLAGAALGGAGSVIVGIASIATGLLSFGRDQGMAQATVVDLQREVLSLQAVANERGGLLARMDANNTDRDRRIASLEAQVILSHQIDVRLAGVEAKLAALGASVG